MKFKSVSPWWPLCLFALSGAAHADLEPYSFGASETLIHQSNVERTNDALRQADWLSTTEFTAALDQALGRDRLTANAAFDINRYKKLNSLDANTYDIGGAFNWETIGDLSGAIGADSRRRQYFYGLNGEIPISTGSTLTSARNLETDNHVYANAQLGGMARWTLFTGFDANQRTYSSSLFDANEERQWSANAGTRYSTSPDLSFGITGSVTHGLYPHLVISGAHDDFDLKSLDLTTKWQASGNSALDASIGYTDAHYTAQSPSKFVNGSLNWNWTPPSHISVVVGLSRDSDSDTASTGSLVNNSSLTGRSINNVAHIAATYAFSPKTSLVANAQYTERHYFDALLPVIGADGTTGTTHISGSNRTSQFSLGAHFLPTRTTDLSCSVLREVRKSDAQIVLITPSYTNNSVFCAAAIKFD